MRKRNNSRAILIAAAAIVLTSLGYVSWKWWNPSNPPVSSPTPQISATKPADNPNFEKLRGKWLRPDGGYVIEVRSVDEGGKIDAAYLNPQPIHVASARASMDDESMKVLIRLSDVNYPGSTYMLTYDPKGDQLKGTYYQALQQQHFDVTFSRME